MQRIIEEQKTEEIVKMLEGFACCVAERDKCFEQGRRCTYAQATSEEDCIFYEGESRCVLPRVREQLLTQSTSHS